MEICGSTPFGRNSSQRTIVIDVLARGSALLCRNVGTFTNYLVKISVL